MRYPEQQRKMYYREDAKSAKDGKKLFMRI